MRMKKLKKMLCICAMCITVILLCGVKCEAASNPYPLTQDMDKDGYTEIPCTRFAWQQVYDNLGVALPAWGNAVNWWQAAINAGYATGNTPKAGAVAVWEGDYYGHVAYVTSGSGNTFTVNEGGRTDKDHTSSQGVAYGYTLTNSVGGTRPYDPGKKLLGFIYPNDGSSNHVNLGDSFYAIILRTDVWQPIKCVDDNVVLSSTEKHISQEHWKFVRQSDGSYVIQSLYNGKVMDVFSCGNADGTNVWLYEQGDAGNTAQKWYIYTSGSGYKLVPQCATDKALDVAGGGTADGTNIQIYTQNASAAQTFSIYKFNKIETPDITGVTPTVSISSTGLMTASFSNVWNVHHYDIVLQGTNHQELDYINVETNTSGSLQLPRYGVYYVKTNAYGANGAVTSSKLTRCVWAGPRVDVGTDVITMIQSKKGRYLFADTDNNVVKVVDKIDYNNLDNYFFKIIRLNDNNDILIRSMANEKVLTVNADSITSGNKIGLSTYVATNLQTFAVKNNYEQDAFVIYPSAYSCILDTGDASGDLYIYDYTHYANDNQYFNLRKLNMNPVVIGFEGEYDGKKHVISISDIPHGATIEYKLGLDGTWNTSHPICQETGSYDVYYKVEHEYYSTCIGSANITITEKENDSKQDSNVNDEKNDSEQNNSVNEDEKNDVQQEDINDNTENLDDDGDYDSEECIEVGSRVELSTGSYVVRSVSGNAREVTYFSLENTKKTSITIPATVDINGYTYQVSEIAPKAFKNNKKLKSVTIGKNVKKIGREAFYNCKKLKKITIKSKILKSVGKNAIKGINKKATIKVPKKQLKKYKKLFKSKTGYKKSMKIKK